MPPIMRRTPSDTGERLLSEGAGLRKTCQMSFWSPIND